MREPGTLFEARTFVLGLRRDLFVGKKAFTDKEALGLWELRHDREALELAADTWRRRHELDLDLEKALPVLKEGKDQYRIFIANRGASRRYSSYFPRGGLDGILLPLEYVLPDAANGLKEIGTVAFAANGANVAFDLPEEGTLPNGIRVRRVCLPQVPFSTLLSAKYENVSKDLFSKNLDLRNGEHLFFVFSEIGYPSHADTGETHRHTWNSSGILTPLMSDGPRLVPWEGKYFYAVNIFERPFNKLLVISDRPAKELAAHLEYLSVMIAPAEEFYDNQLLENEQATESLKQGAAPELSGAFRDARKLRFISVHTGALFLALARLADEEGARRLFGPIRAVALPDPVRGTNGPEADEGEWIELRLPGNGRACRLGKDPVPELSPKSLPFFKQRRERLLRAGMRAALYGFCREAYGGLNGNGDSICSVSEKIRAAMDQSIDAVIEICRESGITRPDFHEWLAITLFEGSRRDKRFKEKVREILKLPDRSFAEKTALLRDLMGNISLF